MLFTQTLNQKQEQILQGALRLFLKTGFAGTSMDRVAEAAGVSKQTIYAYFGDKKGLFQALIQRVTIANFQEVIDRAAEISDPETLLRELAQIYLVQVAGNPDYLALLRIIVAESERFPELAKLFTRVVIQEGRSHFCRYCDQHPELGIRDPEAIAQIFFGTLVSHVLVQEILYGKETMPIESDRIVDSLVQLILNQ
jgi:AcrR family transcriptional regulator